MALVALVVLHAHALSPTPFLSARVLPFSCRLGGRQPFGCEWAFALHALPGSLFRLGSAADLGVQIEHPGSLIPIAQSPPAGKALAFAIRLALLAVLARRFEVLHVYLADLQIGVLSPCATGRPEIAAQRLAQRELHAAPFCRMKRRRNGRRRRSGR